MNKKPKKTKIMKILDRLYQSDYGISDLISYGCTDNVYEMQFAIEDNLLGICDTIDD